MKYSQLFAKTQKTAPKDETSVNAKLLIRAGFITKEVAGVYNFLPLGLRVLEKITGIVREEMNAVSGQEMLLSALQNRQNWQKTGRWNSFDALFKLKSRYDSEYALGPTHEEVLVPIAKNFIHSYRDLPQAVYQIQTKFRDEPRAKSGLLRCREFLMKDLYSFHATEKDMLSYYEKMKVAYKKVFSRCGLAAIETKAGGGTFSDYSHEFQVATVTGEDEIIYCPHFVPLRARLRGASRGMSGYHFSENKEITKKKDGDPCPVCDGKLLRAKTIEVGNIFPLKDKFSKAFNLTYKNKAGVDKLVQMGCYGLGITRTMGTIVEVHHDEVGIIWPKSVAPYQVHLIHLGGGQLDSSEVIKVADEVYEKLTKAGIEVLYDDRTELGAGEKFADYDLIGIPVRLVVSEKIGRGKVEWKNRAEIQVETLKLEEAIVKLS